MSPWFCARIETLALLAKPLVFLASRVHGQSPSSLAFVHVAPDWHKQQGITEILSPILDLFDKMILLRLHLSYSLQLIYVCTANVSMQHELNSTYVVILLPLDVIFVYRRVTPAFVRLLLHFASIHL